MHMPLYIIEVKTLKGRYVMYVKKAQVMQTVSPLESGRRDDVS